MYLLDTNTIIDFFSSNLPESARVILNNEEPKISVITYLELFASSKISETELTTLKLFIEIVQIYKEMDDDLLLTTIQIRKQNSKLKLPDAIIAATAITKNLILITRNTEDFKNITELKTINPFEL